MLLNCAFSKPGQGSSVTEALFGIYWRNDFMAACLVAWRELL